MHTIYDILGCGFGPANLGIAVALVDKWGTEQPTQVNRAIFVEKYPEFQWHPGMLLPGTKMQISCLKDLATLRNPTSAFTFLSYLHAHNRLSEFINRGTTIPSRREFADYLGWAARKVTQKGIDVAYGEEVVSVSKETLDEQELIRVTSRILSSGELVVRWTKYIIISPGGKPRFPPIITRLLSKKGEKQTHIIHTSSYVNSIGPILSRLNATGSALKLAVLGGGQSAAECLIDLHRRLESSTVQGHRIDMIIQKGSLKPSDDSPFVNEIFDPRVTDEWYHGSTERSRSALLSEYKNTNYSVVNPVTIDALYDLIYDQKLSDSISHRSQSTDAVKTTHINIQSYCSVVHAVLSQDAEQGHNKITLTLHQKHTLQLLEETYDMLICGTGYDRNIWLDIIRSSNLADDYGLAHLPDEGLVKLVPDHDPSAWNHDTHGKSTFTVDNDSETESASSNSLGTSPPLSPRMEESPPEPILVRISRKYQLIPHRPSANRIYIQGCAEASHGISDTLLSVIAVRSGEVVDDIWEAEKP